MSGRGRAEGEGERGRERTDGQTIIATGPSPFTNGILPSSSSESMMAGSENASVLPDPVKAMPIMSRPEKAVGIPWIWIGVGLRIFLALRYLSRGGGSFMSCSSAAGRRDWGEGG